MIRSGMMGKLGCIRVKGPALLELRVRVFERSKRQCEECRCPITWNNFEMAHIQSRGRLGSDTIENVRALCRQCHRAEHQPRAVRTK